ncbi:MAG: hypothetical protein NTV49_01150 [Kiritimatiellaeota bacterium]|nr:hypothetical protein [Kiritimatiellota bacterium]
MSGWRLKKPEGDLYGPVAWPAVLQWAAHGRIGPEDPLSADGDRWVPAPSVAELNLVWVVTLDDGAQAGPYHASMLVELLADGAVSGSTRMHHAVTRAPATVFPVLKTALLAGEIKVELGPLSAALCGLLREQEAWPSPPPAPNDDAPFRKAQPRDVLAELAAHRQASAEAPVQVEPPADTDAPRNTTPEEAPSAPDLGLLWQELMAARGAVAQMEADRRQTTQQHQQALEEQAAAAGAERQALNAQREGLQRDVAAARAEIEVLQAAARQASAFRRECDVARVRDAAEQQRLSGLLLRAQQEAEAALQRAGQREAAASQTAQQLEVLNGERVVARQELARLEAARREAVRQQQQNQAEQDALCALCARCAALEAAQQAASAEREALTQAVRCEQERAAANAVVLAQRESVIAALRGELTSAQDGLAQARQEHGRQQETIRQQRLAQTARAEAGQQELREQLGCLKKDLAAAREHIEVLNTAAAEAARQILTLRDAQAAAQTAEARQQAEAALARVQPVAEQHAADQRPAGPGQRLPAPRAPLPRAAPGAPASSDLYRILRRKK